MNEVYVIAGGEWLRNNLNAIAAFMSTRTWDSIEKIALTLSVLAVAVMWVQRHNVMDLLGWVAVFVLISLLVNVRTSVQIIDNSDLVKVHRVDNVPVGLAMPLSLTTRIGHAMVVSYEMIFTQPDSVTYSKTGMLFGANLIVKSTDFLSRNPEIINLFQDYVQNCVLGDIYLNHKYTLEDLMASADPYTLIFSRPSPLRGVYDNNNNFITCKDASVTLKDRLNLDTKTGGKTWHYYVQQIFGGRPDPDLLFRQLVSDSYSYFYGSSQSASQIMRQNVTINALKEGITSNAARNGDTASLVNLATTSSMEKQRLAHVSIGHVTMRNLPMVQTILTGIAIGIFPLLVLAAVFNKLTLSVLKGYVFALMWLQTWPLLYAILNSASKRAARTVLTGMCYSVGSATRQGEQFADPVYRPVGYDVKDIAEVAFWLHSVQFARPDQAVQQRSPLSSMIRTEEQVVFAAQTDHPQRIFSDVIVRLSPAIICIVRQRRPLVQGVCERFRQF